MQDSQVTNALSVDVEDYFHVSAMAGSISRDDWDAMPSRVERNTRKLLDLFDELEVQGTFFVLGWVAERYPSLVREIHEREHEVACHGMSHRLIYEQKIEDFRSETVSAKKLIEDLIGDPINGYRAASFSIVSQSLWALDVLCEAGFSYDSSIFPVRHDLYGIPGAERWPHTLTTSAGARIAEFPPTSFDLGIFRIPASGGGFFRIYPYSMSRQIMRSINNSAGEPCMFYMHPWEIDPGQPRIKAPLKSRLRHYLNLSRFEGRLRKLLADFSFTTVRAVLQSRELIPAKGSHALPTASIRGSDL